MLRAHITLTPTVHLHISKVQRTGDWKYLPHSPFKTKTNPALPVYQSPHVQFRWVFVANVQTRTHLRLSIPRCVWGAAPVLYLPNLIQVPPPVANGQDVHVCDGELCRASILPWLSSSLVVLQRSTQTKGYVTLLFMSQALHWFWLWENPKDDIKIVAESLREKSCENQRKSSNLRSLIAFAQFQ